MATMNQVIDSIKTVQPFIGPAQLEVMGDACRGEEREFFKTMFVKLAEKVTTMPKTYQTDGQGDKAVVHLHYFLNDMNWYITERDMEDEQIQAFGYCDLGWGYPELGYVSIEEITQAGAELDLYWTEKTLGEVKAKS